MLSRLDQRESVPVQDQPQGRHEKPLPGEPRPKAPREVPVMVTPTATYAPELGGSTAIATQQALNQAAAQIVQMMEVWR